MEIEYLKMLRDNPSLEINKSGYFSTIKGIPLLEIEVLEQTWNNGNSFPKTLRELLFLAGARCFVFNYGIYATQQELQETIREDLVDNGKTIIRPFYIMDTWNADQFSFIYLDEGNNPYIYDANSYNNGSNWFYKTNYTIQRLAESRIESLKRGENPY